MNVQLAKELPMQAIVRRAVLPAMLSIGGLASLIYGAIYHSAPVLEEHQSQTTIEVPTAFAPPPFGDGRFPGGPPSFPGRPPFSGPPLQKKTVTRIELSTIVESEPQLTREVSVGGVALLESGELKRTYSGKGPALCPS
jgi:hypothetical protein